MVNPLIWIMKAWSSVKLLESEKLRFCLLGIASVVVFSSLLWYIFVGYEIYLHSDSSVKILLAQLIWDTGEFFPSTFITANGDLWLGVPFFPLVFLTAFIKDTFRAYSLNSLFFISISFCFLNYLLRQIKISSADKWMFRLIFFSGFSFYYAGFLFGEMAYISTFLLFLLMFGDAIKLVVNKEAFSNKQLVVRILIYTFFFTQNPARYFVFFLVPFTFSIFCLYIKSALPAKNLGQLVLMLPCALLASFFIHNGIVSNIINLDGAAALYLSNAEGAQSVSENFYNFVMGTFRFLGMQIGTGGEIYSLKSIYNLLIFAFIIFFIFEVCSTTKHKFLDKSRNHSLFLFSVYLFYGNLFITFYLYLFYSPLAVNIFSMRYFYSTFWCAFFLFALYVSYQKGLKKSILTLFIVSISVIGSYYSYVRPSAPDANSNHSFQAIANEVINLGLKKGYGTYWNTGALVVKGDGEFKMAGVHLANFEAFEWLADMNSFIPQDIESSFFIATGGEIDWFENVMELKGFRSPAQKILIDGYSLYIFDYDIAIHLQDIYPASLEEGINFSIRGYPAFISSVSGMSGYESSFRWTEGERARFKFIDELPSSFELEFQIIPYGPNINNSLKVRVGNIEEIVQLKAGATTYIIQIDLESPSSMLEFIIPEPSSPTADGVVIDSRELGVAFYTLKIRE